MGTLNVGRVGIDAVTISDPRDWNVRGSDRREIHNISGTLRSTSLANTKALRRELVNQLGQIVAVTYSTDDSFDGYYILRGADFDSRFRLASLQNEGLFEYSLDLEWIGDHASVEFLSNVTGVLVTNDHGLIESEVTFFHAPPVAGDDAYTAGGGVTATSRTTEDGSIPVFLDVPLTSGLGAAKWGCAPADFYKGAARIDVGGYTRTGKNAPMQPANWVMGNGLIEVRAETFGGSSIGDISLRAYNSGWGSWTSFDVVWNSTADIPEWHYFNIIRNSPEVCIVQLTRDADEAPPTDSRHTLTMTLRRGSALVSCYYSYSTAVALTIDRAATDAATSITPTGASSAMAARDSADDGNGNRWVIGAADASAIDTVNGGVDMASATSHGFFIGFEIGGSGADSNNNASALCLQFLAAMNETVQAVRR